MSWTAPMTASPNSVFTAAQFNTFVRDNLLETAPAKVSAAGQVIVGTGANQIVARTPGYQITSGLDTTTSGTLGDLVGGAGPAVTVTTGTIAQVFLYADMFNSSTFKNFMGVGVTGASTIAASDANSISHADTQDIRPAGWVWLTGLTAGSNTFTAKYRVNGGTGSYSDRKILVIPYS
jgi:hypothetical protein